jgi:protein SCO1/2
MKIIIYSILSVFLFAILALVVIDYANESRYEIADYGAIPEFQFTERSGQPFGKAQMIGKISILNFFFTNCKGPCPVMNSKVAELYRKYSTSGDVHFVSVSVDPERDTLEALNIYAENYGVRDNRWLFLRGEQDKVHALSEKGFMLAGELPDLHSTKLVLIDSRGHLRGFYNSFDDASLELLTMHVKVLLKREV